MKFKALLKTAKIREFTPKDIVLPALPKEGVRLLQGVAGRFSGDCAAVFNKDRFDSDIEVSSYPSASSSWYSDRRIRFLIWEGDLTIEGDLIDDDFQMPPILVVRGNLTVRSWLRGGMPAFIGGGVRASGFIVGHYNDSALFVGGDLTAAGYLPGAKPYPDLPKVRPHQIGGKVDARTLSLLDTCDDELRSTFVEDVLGSDSEGVSLDEKSVLERVASGKSVWR